MGKFPLKESQWLGQPAYVVGGGESLRSFDWSLLKGKPNVIVINRAFVNVPGAAVWFSEDLRVLELYHRTAEWKAFRGVRVLHALKSEFGDRARQLCRGIALIERRREDKFWSRRFEDGLSISSNSGVGAINLAWLLGADPIYLLGFDCAGGNYHEDYVRAGFDQAGRMQLDTYKSDFENWVAPHVRDRRVINLTNAEHTSSISSRIWPKWDADSTIRTGRPSHVFCDFKREVEVRFDAVELTGVEVSSSDVTGRGREVVGPPK